MLRHAVPFFFLTSGYLMGERLKPACQYGGDTTYLQKALLKNIKMYCKWTMIYIPLTIYGFILEGQTLFSSVKMFIVGFLFIGEQYNSYPLWYILSTVYALWLLLLLLKTGVPYKAIIVLSIIVGGLSITITNFVGLDQLTGGLYFIQKIIKVTVANGRILRGFPYIVMGLSLTRIKIPNVINSIVLCGALIGNYLVDDTTISAVFLFLSSLALFQIIVSVDFAYSPMFLIFRYISKTVFFMHMYTWTVYYLLRYGEKTYGMDSFLFAVLITVFMGVIVGIKRTSRIRLRP